MIPNSSSTIIPSGTVSRIAANQCLATFQIVVEMSQLGKVARKLGGTDDRACIISDWGRLIDTGTVSPFLVRRSVSI